jgi:glucose/arabinose dehydrogenase
MSHKLTSRISKPASMLLLVLCMTLLRPDAHVASAQSGVSWPTIGVSLVADGLDMPVHVTHAGNNSGLLYVVEQPGRIRIIRDGALVRRPFLDITDRVLCCGEQGLLSVAFPPDFRTKRYFYVYYTARGEHTRQGSDLIIARFRLLEGSSIADPGSEEIVLTIPHPTYGSHNGGQLFFGPRDGYLYLATGDGGGPGDPDGNAQNPASLLGKLLRIDVESGNPATYTIPPDNPFVGVEGYREELWALGLRNPWRFSFDRHTGDLYLGDVGQYRWEEINFQPASSTGGENYGWSVMEGPECYNDIPCDPSLYVPPVATFPNPGQGACASVTGGYVYRGPYAASLQGIYFFADHCTGLIWGLKWDGSAWQTAPLFQAGFRVPSFGEDRAGNLYLVRYAAAGSGGLYRLVEVTDDPSRRIHYGAWRGVTDPLASGGGYRAATGPDSALFQSSTPSTTIGLVTYRGPDQGRARVTIDGVSMITLDLYSPTPEYQYIQEFTGLSNDIHSIDVRALGTKRAASSGTEVRVDGFQIGDTRVEDDSLSVRYGMWNGGTNTRAYGGGLRRTARAGAFASFEFTGPDVVWITARGPVYGLAEIYIDGSPTPYATVDLYQPTTQWQHHHAISNLGNGPHVITIRVLGLKNDQSTGTNVVLDGFAVP